MTDSDVAFLHKEADLYDPETADTLGQRMHKIADRLEALNNKANASLIAAAPEMLEALRGFVSLTLDPTVNAMLAHKEVEKAAIAAIARAEGHDLTVSPNKKENA